MRFKQKSEPVVSEPIRRPASRSHEEFPNGSSVTIKSPMRTVNGMTGIVDNYWPYAAGGPVFTVNFPGKDDPFYMDYREFDKSATTS